MQPLKPGRLKPCGPSRCLFHPACTQLPHFYSPFFLFLPPRWLASQPPTSVHRLRRIREWNNVLRLIICSIKLNHISADSLAQVGTSDQLDECFVMNGCHLTPVRLFFGSQLPHCGEEKVLLKLNSVRIDCNICSILYSAPSGTLTSPLTPASFLTDMTSCAAVAARIHTGC